jgi:hypothetical protein
MPVNRSPFVALLSIAFALIGPAAAAQPVPAPLASASPVAQPAQPGAAPPQAVPANLTVDVTGAPATDPDVLDAQIRAALDRAIRPLLPPGAAVRYGPIVPWPLLPLARGARTAANVNVTIEGAGETVTSVTTVTVENVPVPATRPKVLFLSDDPEYLQSNGIVFRGDVTADRPARLYYYHSDIGLPRDLDVVLTSTAPSRVHLIASASGPDLDPMSVGHTVSRDALRFQRDNEGIVADLVPGKPFVVRHALILQGEVVAGSVDLSVLGGGPVAVSVVATDAGGRLAAYLGGPRVPYDGHARHGVFDLDGFGDISRAYVAGGPDVAVQYGSRAATPRNLDPADPGHDYGDYGVVHRITFTLANPTDAPRVVYLYEKPLGGPVRSSFLVDGQLKELGCVRLPQPYWITTYQIPPHTTGASTTLTMTDGGSFYPLEFGATETQPLPYTPPVGTAQGCSPNVTPFTAPVASLRR